MIRRLLLAAALMLTPTVAAAKWHEASSAHFVVYSDQDPEKLRAFATRLERFDQALRYRLRIEDHPVGAANRLSVYVVSNVDAVQRLAGSSVSNVAGFYVGRASGSVAFVPRRNGSGDQNDLNGDTIFFHEYAHHFMLGNFTGVYPAWFIEGFAEFYSTAKVGDDGTVGLGLPAHHRAYGAVLGGLSLPRMLAGDYAKLSEAETEALYGRGWLLTHFLQFEPGRSDQMSAYLKLIGAGRPAGDAATTAFGDLKKLDRELDRYVRRPRMNYLKIDMSRFALAPVTVRALRPGEAAFMPVRMRSVRGVDERTAKALVVNARRAAAPYPADATVQTWLAEVEHDAGNLADAEAAADRALAAASANGDAMIYKGRVKMAQAVAANATDPAVWREARRWFIEASRADTEDAEPKVLYFVSFAAAGAAPTRNAVEALIYAQQLVPQDDELRMHVVRQHLFDGKTAEARDLFGPIAYHPHAGTAQRDWSAKVMAKLAAQDAKGALALWDEHAEASGGQD